MNDMADPASVRLQAGDERAGDRGTGPVPGHGTTAQSGKPWPAPGCHRAGWDGAGARRPGLGSTRTACRPGQGATPDGRPG